MTFQSTNEPGIPDARDRASLQPADWKDKAEPPSISRDRRMPWKPDLVLDSTEWIQRAMMGDDEAIKQVVLVVAPLLLAEVQRLRKLGSGDAS